jgi:putative transposase
MWITAQELTQVAGMPSTVQGILYKAKIENWERRRAQGIKGGAYEYNFFSLSVYDQARVLKSKNKIMIGNQILDKPEPKEKSYCAETLWAKWEKATDKQKDKAKVEVAVVLAVKAIVDAGTSPVTAFDVVAQSHGCNPSAARRWYYTAIKVEQSEYLPALLDGSAFRDYSSRQYKITPEAWDFFVANYFRPEQPAFNACYQMLCDVAKERGWDIPHKSSLRRKIEREITPQQQVWWRKGEHALMQLYPAQQRSVI